VLPVALSDECHLRLLEEADAEELHGLIEANRAYLARWMDWAAAQTPEATLQFVRLTRQQLEGNNGFQAAIVCNGEIVGVAGFHSVEWTHRSTSIGYWLDEQHQGRGVMTRAVRALIDHAFGEWDLHRVEIQAATENRRSRAIPERLGFREEGVRREAEWIGERCNDLAVYAMLASEWVQEGA
jgi:ribosomal-protein-serine acetyltransferase